MKLTAILGYRIKGTDTEKRLDYYDLINLKYIDIHRLKHAFFPSTIDKKTIARLELRTDIYFIYLKKYKKVIFTKSVLRSQGTKISLLNSKMYK